ncbi:hypothetical protein GOBAR_DD10630 [Gossypium barbadense]|nr:hypothetical protein GOBAR_DD10630 [Gossypium barbadense]
MPRLKTIKPKNFPTITPKEHLARKGSSENDEGNASKQQKTTAGREDAQEKRVIMLLPIKGKDWASSILTPGYWGDEGYSTVLQVFQLLPLP